MGHATRLDDLLGEARDDLALGADLWSAFPDDTPIGTDAVLHEQIGVGPGALGG